MLPSNGSSWAFHAAKRLFTRLPVDFTTDKPLFHLVHINVETVGIEPTAQSLQKTIAPLEHSPPSPVNI